MLNSLSVHQSRMRIQSAFIRRCLPVNFDELSAATLALIVTHFNASRNQASEVSDAATRKARPTAAAPILVLCIAIPPWRLKLCPLHPLRGRCETRTRDARLTLLRVMTGELCSMTHAICRHHC
jgi:hypothetical protein